MVEVDVKRKEPSGGEAAPTQPGEPPIYGLGGGGGGPQQGGCAMLLVRWAISAAAIWILAELLPGIAVDGYSGALWVTWC